MSGNSGIVWTNPIPKNVALMSAKLAGALTALVTYEATRSEAYMRENAPWSDQTSNARNGLFAKPIRGDNQFGIVLYHTMPYGIWLEVKYSGKYAIILPTVQVKSRDVMSGARAIMSRLGGLP